MSQNKTQKYLEAVLTTNLILGDLPKNNKKNPIDFGVMEPEVPKC